MKKNIVRIGLISVTLLSLVAPTFAAEVKDINDGKNVYVTYQKKDSHNGLVRELDTYSVGTADEEGGVAEIVTYNKKDRRFYVVSGVTQSIDIVEIDSNGKTKKLKTVEIGKVLKGKNIVAGDMTSVSYNDNKELLAVAVQYSKNDPKITEGYDKNGHIVILDKDGKFVDAYECGVQPDMVTFTKNGRYILSANEGEPREGYVNAVDPEGTVTIVDLENKTSKNVRFDINRDQAIADGVLIKKGATPEEDLEPEYITISDDDKTAFVSLQENNAIASIDIERGDINYVKGLGFIDHMKPGNEIDAVRDKNQDIKIVNVNFLGTPMPDGIKYLKTIHGEFILTANEGDAREWGKKPNKYENVDSKKFDDTADKKTEFLLNSETDVLDDERIHLLGGRSFSIYNANTLERVYNSGSDFERITANLFPDFFNTDNDGNDGEEDVKDKRSNKKGPEPENVETIRVGNKVYVIIGLERISGIMIYDVTNPMNPVFADYFNNRIFVKEVEKGETVGLDKRGNIGPEGLFTIETKDSPTGRPLVLVANEISGTVQVIEFIYDEIEKPIVKPEEKEAYSNWDDYLVNNDTKVETHPVYANADLEKGVKTSEATKTEDKKVETKEDNKETEKIYKFYIGKDNYEILNGENKNSKKIDAAPIIENDRTLLPMRVIAEALGIEVEYDESTRTAIFKQNDKITTIQIDSDEMDVNGEKVKLYSKVKIVNDRILLPLTNISKAFDLTNGNVDDGERQNIEWNGEERSVTITKF